MDLAPCRLSWSFLGLMAGDEFKSDAVRGGGKAVCFGMGGVPGGLPHFRLACFARKRQRGEAAKGA